MKNIYLGLIVLLIVTISSCRTESDVPGASVYIDLDTIETANWENIFDDLEVIPLEFTPESMLVNIHKILKLDGDYILFDKDRSVVYKFDSKGKYISKLDRLGSGPGEYQGLYDMFINPFTKNIELLSPAGTIYAYTKDFEWIETIDIGDIRSVHKFEYFSEDIIALYSNDYRVEDNVLLYSKKEDKLINKMKFEPSVFEINQLMMLGNPLVQTGKDLLLCIPFSNKVYKIGLNGVTLANIWDFGKYNFDKKGLESSNSRDEVLDVMSYNTKNNFSSFYNYIENSELIFAQFIFKSKFCSMAFVKDTGEYMVINDFMPTETISLIDDKLVAYSHTDMLDKFLKSNPNGEYNNINLTDSEFESNPVLLIYKFKNEF